MTPKTFDSYLLDMMNVEFMTNFSLVDSSELMAVESFRPYHPKTFDSYFLDMMYVEFMKNFLIVDSSGLLAFGLILASWAKNILIPSF